MIYKLGTYEFSPTSFDDSKESNYDQVNIIGGKPTVQASGDKLREISFGIFLDASFTDPQNDIDILESMQSNKEVLRLINGEGKNFGNFVIVSTPRQANKIFKDGHLWSVNLTINLLEYNSITDVSVSAPALSVNNPSIEDAIKPLSSPALSINEDIKNGKIQLAKIDVVSQPSVNGFSMIKSNALKAKTFFVSASDKIKATTKIYYRAQSTVASLSDITTGIDDMISACNIHSFNDLVSANERTIESLNVFSSDYARIVSFIASREGGN